MGYVHSLMRHTQGPCQIQTPAVCINIFAVEAVERLFAAFVQGQAPTYKKALMLGTPCAWWPYKTRWSQAQLEVLQVLNIRCM